MANSLNKIEVVTDYKHLQIREIMDNGGYHRRVLTCDQTIADDGNLPSRTRSKI